MDSFPMSWQPISSYPSPQKKKNSGGGPRLSLKESTKVVQSFQASVFRFKDNRENKFSVWKRKLRPNTRFWDISFFRTSEGWNSALIRCFPIIKLWQLIATNDFTLSMPTADWCQKLVKLSLFVMNAAPFPHVSNPPAPHCRSHLPGYEIYFTRYRDFTRSSGDLWSFGIRLPGWLATETDRIP